MIKKHISYDNYDLVQKWFNFLKEKTEITFKMHRQFISHFIVDSQYSTDPLVKGKWCLVECSQQSSYSLIDRKRTRVEMLSGKRGQQT